MTVLATMRVNDRNDGELLAKTEGVFTCDECEDLEEFENEHGEDIEEFLENSIHPEIITDNSVIRIEYLELADEPAEVA